MAVYFTEEILKGCKSGRYTPQSISEISARGWEIPEKCRLQFIENVTALISFWLKSDIKKWQVYGIDCGSVAYRIIGDLASDRLSPKLTNPEIFWEFLVNYIRNNFEHYKLQSEKMQCCGTIEQRIVDDIIDIIKR